MTTALARGARLVPALLLLALPLAGCDDDRDDALRGTLPVDRVEVQGRVWADLPVVLYEGWVTDGQGNRYEARYELRSAALELRSGGGYAFTGEYTLVSVNGDFTTFSRTARETGTVRVVGERISFYADELPFLELDGRVERDEVTVGVADPVFAVVDPYTFRR